MHLQFFVTPTKTHGFGWHYDAEDVFVVQTDGVKDYFFRENTRRFSQPFTEVGLILAAFAGKFRRYKRRA